MLEAGTRTKRLGKEKRLAERSRVEEQRAAVREHHAHVALDAGEAL